MMKKTSIQVQIGKSISNYDKSIKILTHIQKIIVRNSQDSRNYHRTAYPNIYHSSYRHYRVSQKKFRHLEGCGTKSM